MVVRSKSISMIKHGHSAVPGREKSPVTPCLSHTPQPEQGTSAPPKMPAQGSHCAKVMLETPRPSFSFCSSFSSPWSATSLPQRGRNTPASPEHLQDAPRQDAGSSPSPEGSPKPAQLERLLAVAQGWHGQLSPLSRAGAMEVEQPQHSSRPRGRRGARSAPAAE